MSNLLPRLSAFLVFSFLYPSECLVQSHQYAPDLIPLSTCSPKGQQRRQVGLLSMTINDSERTKFKDLIQDTTHSKLSYAIHMDSLVLLYSMRLSSRHKQIFPPDWRGQQSAVAPQNSLSCHHLLNF